MSGLSLYQISEMWLDSLEALEGIEDEKELELAVKDLNAQMSEVVRNKAENIVKYNTNINSQIQILKEEKARLDSLIKRLEKRQDTMNKSVSAALELIGVDKVETTYGNISFRTKPLSVELEEGTDLGDIPKEFIRTTVKEELDKRAVQELYKNEGIKLAGVKYNENQKSIIYK